MTIYCSNCHAPLQSGESFCRNCGQRMTPPSGPPTHSEPTVSLASYPNVSYPPHSGAGPAPGSIPLAPTKNRKSSVGLFLGLLLLALIGLSVAAWLWLRHSPVSQSVILRLHGSNTMGASMIPSLAEEFFRQQGAKDVKRVLGKTKEEMTIEGILPGDSAPKVIEIKAYGSDTAFIDLAKGECDIGLASRKIKPEELQQLSSLGDMTARTSERVLALDGIAIIINGNNPVSKLTKDQIAQIFSGEIKNWSQVSGSDGSINVYARDDKSGTYDTFKSLVLGKERKLVGTAKRLEDSKALSSGVATDPNGIGFVGLPFIGSAKAVAVSESGATPLKPSRFTVATEDYLLTRRLYLYAPPNSQNTLVSKFIEFALSPKGQEVVENEQFVSLAVRTEKQIVAKEAPDEYQELTHGAERLSLNFRFRTGKKELDNKALHDIDLVVDILGKSRDAGQKILLMGFTDNIGSADKNTQLSKERAETVAEEFKQRGIAPSEVKGFGAQMPVASNDTKEGQEKNRRVEIWLKK